LFCLASKKEPNFFPEIAVSVYRYSLHRPSLERERKKRSIVSDHPAAAVAATIATTAAAAAVAVVGDIAAAIDTAGRKRLFIIV
jgi:hypothetical protein